MSFCSKCGSEIGPEMNFCGRCGSPVNFGPGTAPQAPPTSRWSKPDDSLARVRPTGITLLAVCSFVITIIMFGLLGVMVYAVSQVNSAILGQIGFQFLNYVTGVGTYIALAEGFFGSVGIAYLITGVGFIKGLKFAWYLGIIDAIFWIISLTLLGAGIGLIFGLILGGLVLYYLTRKRVRIWFRLVRFI